jgi:hypothetical protein
MRRRITAVAALELPCAPEAALPTIWDISDEPPVRTVYDDV